MNGPPNDSDYKLIEKARSNRANGEKVHSLDEVMNIIPQNVKTTFSKSLFS